MAYNGDPEKDLMCQYLDWDKNTMSLETLLGAIEDARRNAIKNGYDPTKVPVVIKFDNLNYTIPWYGAGYGVGRKGMAVFIESGNYFKTMPIVSDVRPKGEGEYWRSRGPSNYDVSGFVNTKQAGERLLRMVKLVLEKDEVETWLDWRETEPEWIQFKFSAKEFDVEKLSKLAKENDNIMTMDIMKECIKKD